MQDADISGYRSRVSTRWEGIRDSSNHTRCTAVACVSLQMSPSILPTTTDRSPPPNVSPLFSRALYNVFRLLSLPGPRLNMGTGDWILGSGRWALRHSGDIGRIGNSVIFIFGNFLPAQTNCSLSNGHVASSSSTAKKGQRCLT